MNHLTKTLISAIVIGFSTSVAAGQFVIELNAPFNTPQASLMSQHKVKIEHSFAADENSYAVFTADNDAALQAFLSSAKIDAAKISEVLFVNSPTVGGGQQAGSNPRDGHGVFVIERPIPGVGFFGIDKKKKISKGSNGAITKLGDIIEWDRSFLTSEGTYCVYRADSPETLREHGALAGVPIGKITAVEHQTY